MFLLIIYCSLSLNRLSASTYSIIYVFISYYYYKMYIILITIKAEWGPLIKIENYSKWQNRTENRIKLLNNLEQFKSTESIITHRSSLTSQCFQLFSITLLISFFVNWSKSLKIRRKVPREIYKPVINKTNSKIVKQTKNPKKLPVQYRHRFHKPSELILHQPIDTFINNNIE